MSGVQASSPTSDLDRLREAACEAWIYGLPLIEIAATRASRAGFGGSLNTFGHMRNLANHKMRAMGFLRGGLAKGSVMRRSWPGWPRRCTARGRN